MAKEGERPTAADKGKGKVDDARELNGQKKDIKDEKTRGKKDGKKDEEPQEGKPALGASMPCLLGRPTLRTLQIGY